MKAWNDQQALKSLCDGVTWDGYGFENGAVGRRELKAGPLCREVLQDMFKFLPLDMSPATVEDGTTSGPEGGFAYDHQRWNVGLKEVRGGVEPPAEEWQRAVTDMLPPTKELDGLHAGYFDAGALTKRRYAVRGGAHTAGGTGVFGKVSSMRPSSCSTTGEVHQR